MILYANSNDSCFETKQVSNYGQNLINWCELIPVSCGPVVMLFSLIWLSQVQFSRSQSTFFF